jgi:hypothetical protein
MIPLMIENTPRSPYHTDPDDAESLSQAPFAGRQDVFGQMYRHFNDPHQRTAFVAAGQRRMGKSALLLALPNAFRETHVGAYVPLARTPDDVALDWVLALAESVALATARRGFSIRKLDDLPPPDDLPGEPFAWFETVYLPAIFGVLRSIMRLALLLDDAHLLVSGIRQGRLPEGTTAFLAGLLRAFPELDIVLTFDAEREAEIDALVPLVMPGAGVRLTTLEPADTAWLLQQPVRGLYAVPEETAAAVHRATGGLPTLSQAFGGALFRLWTTQTDINTITPDDVRDLTPNIYALAQPDFQAAWSRLPANEKIVLAALSGVLYRDPLRQVDASVIESWVVETDARLDIPAINAALRALEYRELVTVTPDGAKLRSGLMHTWLLDHITPDKLPRPSRRLRRGASPAATASATANIAAGALPEAGGLRRPVRVPTWALFGFAAALLIAAILTIALLSAADTSAPNLPQPTVTLALEQSPPP